MDHHQLALGTKNQPMIRELLDGVVMEAESIYQVEFTTKEVWGEPLINTG